MAKEGGKVSENIVTAIMSHAEVGKPVYLDGRKVGEIIAVERRTDEKSYRVEMRIDDAKVLEMIISGELPELLLQKQRERS